VLFRNTGGEDKQDNTGWIIYVVVLIILTVFDRGGVPLLAKCMEDPFPLLWYRVLSETLVFFATIPVYVYARDGLLIGLAAAVMVVNASMLLDLFPNACQAVFGLLAGFYSKELDASLDEIPLAATRNSEAKHFRADQGGVALGHHYYHARFGTPGSDVTVVCSDVTVAFEPAGPRNFANAFHIRCPALPGAPALDCDRFPPKYNVGVFVHLFHSTRCRNQKFVLNGDKTISPFSNRGVVLGSDAGKGQMRLVGRHDTGRRLVFHVELRDGRVVHVPPPVMQTSEPTAPAAPEGTAVIPQHEILLSASHAGRKPDELAPPTYDAMSASGATASAAAVSQPSLASRLLELKEAKDAGLVTDKEYEQARAGVINIPSTQRWRGAQQQQQQQQQPAGPAPGAPPMYGDLMLGLDSHVETSC